MITRLELTNFMSHKHTVIEPAAGLTVLVGPNNVGKSAIVAALQILCSNENSTYVLRHGERECGVQVHTDDGHIIEWRRKTSPRYVINGQVFDRLRAGGLPDELHQSLRLRKVDADGDADFDVHFGTQKDPIFLLKSSPANAARFFASSSDAIRLVAIQKRHKEKLSEAQRDKNRLDAKSRQVNAELELLEPTVAIDQRLKAVEHAYDELMQMGAWLDEAQKDEGALREQAAVMARRAARADALSALSPPPELVALKPLEDLISAVAVEENSREKLALRADVLASLSTPPQMYEVALMAQLTGTIAIHARTVKHSEEECRLISKLSAPPELPTETELSGLVASLIHVNTQLRRYEQSIASLATIASPPVPAPTRDIDDLVAELEIAAQQVRSCQAQFEAAQSNVTTATAQLRKRAAGRQCPVCGTALDPDRIVARAAAGLGGHEHA